MLKKENLDPKFRTRKKHYRQDGSWEKYFDATVIKCKAAHHKLFVDFHPRVWSCNWVASGMYRLVKNKQQLELHKILNYYGWDLIV